MSDKTNHLESISHLTDEQLAAELARRRVVASETKKRVFSLSFKEPITVFFMETTKITPSTLSVDRMPDVDMEIKMQSLYSLDDAEKLSDSFTPMFEARMKPKTGNKMDLPTTTIWKQVAMSLAEQHLSPATS